MSSIESELGDRITYKQLANAVNNGFSPIVEVESMDGIYTVRFHHATGVTEWCDDNGKTLSFLGTGKIRDKLANLGFQNGILTFADQCGDEMIGVAGRPLTPDEMLTYGTRISFC